MIRIRELYKSFDEKFVLNNINLDINKAETKVIIGRSGAGKSVLLKTINGLIRPDSGLIEIEGVDVIQLSEKEAHKLRGKIGMVFQNGALFDSLSVAENVSFYLDEFMRFSSNDIKEKVAEALGMVGLPGTERLMPSSLSGGMRKRVSLARVLCMEPEIILYGEPTTGVDPVTADALNNLIIELRDKLKVTSIVVTHDMSAAFKVADSIAMLYSGTIIADGRVEEIRQCDHPVVQQFIHGKAQGPITDNAMVDL